MRETGAAGRDTGRAGRAALSAARSRATTILAAPRAVIHIDLGKGVPDLVLDTGRGAFVVFWRDGVPLGSVDLGPDDLPLSAVQLNDRAGHATASAVRAHLRAPVAERNSASLTVDRSRSGHDEPARALEQAMSMPADAAAQVSVVICTRDRAGLLRECLQSLLALSPPPHEIVVVDNAPSDEDTRRVVAAHPGVRYVLEPQPGLDAARNSGARHSDGVIVAYTDDDVTVEPNWAARIGHAFADPSIAAVTGLVLPMELETPSQVIFESWWSLGRDFTPRVYGNTYFARHRSAGVPVWDIGAGANMAFRRTVLSEVGGFDERLDAGAAGCSGDSEVWYRLLASGARIRYEPTAVVHHRHRRDMQGLRSQIHHYMRGHAAALLVQFEKHRDWGNLRRLVVTLPSYHARLALRRLRSGVTPRTVTLADEVTGLLAGCRYYAATRWRRSA